MRPVPGLGEHTDSILTWLDEYAAVGS